jgi:hypothetical protein
MKILKIESRKRYLNIQLSAQNKINYCKFSYHDAQKYLKIIKNDIDKINTHKKLGPILSLGTRSGREINLFRIELNSSRLFRWLISLLEISRKGFNTLIPFFENLNHSDYNKINQKSSIGIELSPLAKRSDTWIGSFDEIPDFFNQKFNIIYSNSFDHCMDPYKTASLWRKALQSNGYIIICFPHDQEPQDIDPVGNVNLNDILELFPGELIYAHQYGSKWNYHEYIIRVD